jgi:hypothetical protein
MTIPQDPVILLSFINTYLRDYYTSLTDLCENLNINEAKLTEKLSRIEYVYDSNRNQFI